MADSKEVQEYSRQLKTLQAAMYIVGGELSAMQLAEMPLIEFLKICKSNRIGLSVRLPNESVKLVEIQPAPPSIGI